MADTTNTNDTTLKFEVTTDTLFQQQGSYNKSTITVTNPTGEINESYEQGSNIYFGGNKLTDIIVLNDVPGIEDYTVDINPNTGVVSITPQTSEAPPLPQSLGNPNKLYVWFNDSFNVFVYNPITQRYITMAASIDTNQATRSGTRTTTTESSVYYVADEADINNPSAYEAKTIVYFPQS